MSNWTKKFKEGQLARDQHNNVVRLKRDKSNEFYWKLTKLKVNNRMPKVRINSRIKNQGIPII